MKKNHSIYRLAYFFLLTIIGIIAGCKKFVEVPVPQDIVPASQVFTSDQKADAAVTGIYGSMINGGATFSSYLVTVYTGFSSDELDRMNADPEAQQFIANQLTPDNGYNSSIWNSLYKHIYYANAVLEGLQASTQVTAVTKSKLEAEVKFIRGFCYFYLIQLYGKVPLVTTTDYEVNATLGNAVVDDCYKQILADLEEAETGLPETTPGDERIRADKWAAKALLARIYLYTGQWTKAENAAGEVIGSNYFTPLITPAEIFQKNSRESIWQLVPNSDNSVLPELVELFPYGDVPNTFVTPQLIAAFEPGDARRAAWLDSLEYEGQWYYYPVKYKNISSSVEEYYVMLRIAEQYLIRAEARTRQNELSGALEDLNVIRTRAGLESLQEMQQADLLVAILQEKRIEFFSEWGHRWFDMKRTGQTEAILSPVKSDWQETDTLYPIPQNDLLTNPNLKQNKGY